MTAETKNILKRSINEFLSSTDEEKESYISLVQNKIKEHERALESIGVGYSDNFVTAGKIFLRIFN